MKSMDAVIIVVQLFPNICKYVMHCDENKKLKFLLKKRSINYGLVNLNLFQTYVNFSRGRMSSSIMFIGVFLVHI